MRHSEVAGRWGDDLDDGRPSTPIKTTKDGADPGHVP